MTCDIILSRIRLNFHFDYSAGRFIRLCSDASLDFANEMRFVMRCHVILLAKRLATFRALMLFHSCVRDQMLIQLRCGLKLQRTFGATLVPDIRVCCLQVHPERWFVHKRFLTFITFEKLLVSLRERYLAIFNHFQSTYMYMYYHYYRILTWIRMCSTKLALCLSMVPHTTHFNWFSCKAVCSDKASFVLSATPQISHRK